MPTESMNSLSGIKRTRIPSKHKKQKLRQRYDDRIATLEVNRHEEIENLIWYMIRCSKMIFAQTARPDK